MKASLIIKTAGLFLFAAVLFYGWSLPIFDVDTYLDQFKARADYTQIYKKPDIFTIRSDSIEGDYVGFSSYIGYGGPLTVATTVGEDGKIISVEVVAHKETPVYMGKLVNKRFYRQFAGKDVGEALHIDADIDSVSGATITCRAITESVRAVGHNLAANTFNTPVTVTKEKFTFGAAEISVLLYFLAVLIFSTFVKKPALRLYMLLISIVVIGFWLNRSLSISLISSAFQGYFPLLQQNLIWYLMVIGTFLLVLLTGKNLYCSWICPFGGLQEYANKVTGLRLGFGSSLGPVTKIVRDIFMFALLGLSFLMLNPSVAGIEPFGTIFGLDGVPVTWAVCCLSLLASIFSLRFWCNTFCPVGAILDMIAKIKGILFRKIKLTGRADKPTKARKPADTFVVVCWVLLGVSVLAVLWSNISQAM